VGQVFELGRVRVLREKTEVAVVYGLTSLGRDRADAGGVLGRVRGPWGLEIDLAHYPPCDMLCVPHHLPSADGGHAGSDYCRGAGDRNSASRPWFVHSRGHACNSRRRARSAALTPTTQGLPRPPTWRACSHPFFRPPCSVCGDTPSSPARSFSHRSPAASRSPDDVHRGMRGRNPSSSS
jgi:hypothetical protein